MMKTVLLDAKKMKDKDFHDYFKKKLDLEGYHGNNLDAMYDVLSTIREELRIYVYDMDLENMTEYGNSIWRTLRDLEMHRDNISLRTVSISKRY